ncbi:MAG: hypothetical protein WC455_24890 [Dehalococcoidia bacterium]|jgi:hypothetical protein
MKQTIKGAIGLEETRALFFDKRYGLPKIDCLMSIDQICEKLNKPIPLSNPERHLIMGVDLAVVGHLKKSLHKRHLLFVAPRIDGTVLYGFTSDPLKVDNYIERIKCSARAYKEIERLVKQLAIESHLEKPKELTE